MRLDRSQPSARVAQEARSPGMNRQEGRAMDPIITTILFVAGALIGFVVFVLAFRWIWNHTVPAVFGLKAITFWQAVGILILASILTGGHRVVSPDVTNIINVPKRTGAVSATTALAG
jgi:hypothetical protein